MRIHSDKTCSFCKSNSSSISKVIAGPGVNTGICNRCVSFADELLAERNEGFESKGGCSFCLRQETEVAVGPNVSICEKCVAFAKQNPDTRSGSTLTRKNVSLREFIKSILSRNAALSVKSR